MLKISKVNCLGCPRVTGTFGLVLGIECSREELNNLRVTLGK